MHPGQLSELNEDYLKEVLSSSRRATRLEWLMAFCDNLVSKYGTNGIKRRLNPEKHFVYDLSARRWCRFPDRTRE